MPATTNAQRAPKEKENLLRGTVSGVALRAAGEDEGQPTGPVMEGHFAVFNQWTEIDSWEGNFLEMFVPGAFKKTIRENRENMKVLFQHGYDYMIGDKPLGPIEELREEEQGVFYEVPLLDAPYARMEVQPGLEAGLYGASFRFRVIREEIDEDPGVSDYNPRGIPERKVKEAQVPEFGPVTFPAYEGASAGCRSLEASELVAQAALERMESRDSGLGRNLAARFASRSEPITTSPDEPGTQEEPGEPVEPEVEETTGEQQMKDAPPDDSAETPDVESHPDSGRRDNGRLYGVSSVPSWRL
jgi:HK97 family phage prohead protease